MGVYQVNAQAFKVNGTNGAGHIDMKFQNSGVPPSIANSTALYADADGNFAYKIDGNYTTTLHTHTNTANRVYTFQNKSYTLGDSADIAAKVNKSDTSTMLTNYQRKGDSTTYYTKYRSDTSRANIYLTLNGKLNTSDTSTMLTNYIVGAGYGLSNSGKFILIDTTKLTTKSTTQLIDGIKTFSATDTFAKGLITKGDISAASWGGASTAINGINISTIPSNYTNTSSGTVSNIAINTIGGDTLKSSSSVSYVNVYSLLIKPTVAGTNSTINTNNTLYVQGQFGTSGIINGGAQINSASNGFVYTGAVTNTSSFVRASTSAFGLYNNNATTSGYIGFAAAAASGIKIDNTGALTATKINVVTGSNASAGTATLSSGTVTVSTTAVTASSIIILTLQNCSNCGTQYISAKTASTSFTISSTNVLDGSIVGWLIID
jgi:hypothetical protein